MAQVQTSTLLVQFLVSMASSSILYENILDNLNYKVLELRHCW